MALAQFIIARLQADPTISGYVQQAIYPSAAIQDDRPPYILFEEFDGDRYSSMGSDADICDSRVRFHLYHKSFTDAWKMANALRKSLQRYRGTLVNVQVDDVFTIAGGPQFYDVETRTHHLVRDFRIIYRES